MTYHTARFGTGDLKRFTQRWTYFKRNAVLWYTVHEHDELFNTGLNPTSLCYIRLRTAVLTMGACGVHYRRIEATSQYETGVKFRMKTPVRIVAFKWHVTCIDVLLDFSAHTTQARSVLHQAQILMSCCTQNMINKSLYWWNRIRYARAC